MKAQNPHCPHPRDKRALERVRETRLPRQRLGERDPQGELDHEVGVQGVLLDTLDIQTCAHCFQAVSVPVEDDES